MATRWENKVICSCIIDLDYSKGDEPEVVDIFRACEVHKGLDSVGLFQAVQSECKNMSYSIRDLEASYTEEMKALITDETGVMERPAFRFTEDRKLVLEVPVSLKPFVSELKDAVPDVMLS